jgi:hypothetical protein
VRRWCEIETCPVEARLETRKGRLSMFDVGLVGMIATLSLPLIVLVVSTLEDWLFDRIGFFSVFSFKVWSASFLATLSSKECWSVTRWHVAFFSFSPSLSSLVVLIS